VERKSSGALVDYPHLIDVTPSTGIQFEYLSNSEVKFIAESISGGVALIDHDGDGFYG
jgi:hypothetical protein